MKKRKRSDLDNSFHFSDILASFVQIGEDGGFICIVDFQILHS